MSEYQPLTKRIADGTGNEIVVCRHYGEETCRKIHTPNGCEGCPVIRAVLEQLNAFEEMYLDFAGENDESQ